MAENDRKPNPVQVQKYLEGVDYPVQKDELVRIAQSHGAPDDIMSLLKSLPTQEFGSPTAVTKAVGQAK